MNTKNATILWTGGKDSFLAFCEARLQGYAITHLVTFVPTNPNFLAHPLPMMKLQSEGLEIPHILMHIKEPFKEAYVHAIHQLKEKYAIDTLITGDIDEVDGHPNIIQECAKKTGVEVFLPLWKRNREDLLDMLLAYNVQWIFSLVKKPYFTHDWVGKHFTRDTYANLRTLHRENGVDLCGENGEYHSLVLDGPFFKKRIQIMKSSLQEKDVMMYVTIEKATLVGKILLDRAYSPRKVLDDKTQ